MRKILGRLKRSHLGGLAADTGWVAVWQGASAAAAFIQVILITRAFGITEYGRFAIVIASVELVGGFFNPRAAYASTTFGARWLSRDAGVAVGVFQFGWLIDLAATAVGLAVVGVLALTVGPHLVGGSSTDLILIYALALLGPTLSRSAFVVLRLLDRFALIASYAWALELTRLALVVLAIALFDSIAAVMVAIVIATVAAGIINAVVAARVFRRAHNLSMARPHLRRLARAERRAMLNTTGHTLVISSGRAAQNQLPTVLLGAIAGTTQAGIYKIGMAAAAPIALLFAPASNALLPRLAKLWSEGRIAELRRLVVQASAISSVIVLLGLVGVVILQDPVLELITGNSQPPDAAGTVMLLGAVSQALFGLAFWHNTVLFAAHRTGPMSAISVMAVVVNIAAILALVPAEGATGAAIALLISQALANISLAALALRTLRCAGRADRDQPPTEPTP